MSPRRTAEGKTTREIRRCLKRYIARELYRHLTRSMNPPVSPWRITTVNQTGFMIIYEDRPQAPVGR